VIWKTLDDQLMRTRPLRAMGIKGLKIDFMQRDDQAIVNFYHASRGKRRSAACSSTTTAASDPRS